MTTTTSEFGIVFEANYPESVVCVCGNDTGFEGYMLCDEHGNPAYLGIGEAPEGLVRLKDEPLNANFFACHSCGRVYSDRTVIQDNEAPVITRLTHEDLRVKQELYWRVNEF